MNEIINCEYCKQDYWDYLVYIMLDKSIMCIDCVRADVPVRGNKLVA